MIKNDEKFVIRAKKNSDVIYNGKRMNIMEIANKFKGKYSLKFRKKNGMSADCKITIIPIRLICRPKDELNMVVCYGFGKEPMLLITNLRSDGKRLGVTVVKVYLMRWRIEKFYRFKKQQFGFENLRVHSLVSIRNLDMLLTIAIGYIGYISEKCNEQISVIQLIEQSKRIYGARSAGPLMRPVLPPADAFLVGFAAQGRSVPQRLSFWLKTAAGQSFTMNMEKSAAARRRKVWIISPAWH